MEGQTDVKSKIVIRIQIFPSLLAYSTYFSNCGQPGGAGYPSLWEIDTKSDGTKSASERNQANSLKSPVTGTRSVWTMSGLRGLCNKCTIEPEPLAFVRFLEKADKQLMDQNSME